MADWRAGPLRYLGRRSKDIRTDVDEEIRFHLEMRIAELRRRGWTESEARAEAMRQFGDVAATREACVSSDERRESNQARRRYLDELRQDVVHGVRQLRRRPAVCVLAVTMLAVAIGASTAIFSATDHVLLRPLPYFEYERVMTLWETNEAEGGRTLEVSPSNFLDWQRRNVTFEVMGLVEPSSFDVETGDGPPEAVRSLRASQGYFEALGVQPIRGRLFEPRDYEPGAAPVALISEGMWRERYGGDARIVGRTIRLDATLATIVGVLPSSLKYPYHEHLWAPKFWREDELASDRNSQYMHAVGRLRPGVTPAQAQADLTRVATELAAEFPATNRDLRARVIPLQERIVGDVRPALLVMLGAVAFVLLIACANVASLLLASGAERGRELAVRASLGAAPNRLVHQLVTESLLLAGLGGALGLLFAHFAIRALIVLSPPHLPRIETLSIDGRVLLFSIALTFCTAMLFGLAPAMRFAKPDLLSPLRATGRSVTGGRARNRLRNVLVIGEVSLALVLLIGAGLLMRSFITLLENPLGFEQANRATMQVFLWDRNPAFEQRLQRAGAIADALRSLPGVRSVGMVSSLPFHPHAITADNKLSITGRAVHAIDEPSVFTTVASPEYFTAMGIPLVRGRVFSERDRAGAPGVALINETLARRYFPGEDPIGKTVTIGVMSRPTTWEIVGIVGDVRPVSMDSDPRPELFVPYAQHGTGSITFVVHTADNASRMLPSLRDRLWSVDPGQSIYWTDTIENMIGDTLVERRFHLVLLATFSAIALVLAVIGIYGLISYATQQRTGEIGVRMALGAERHAIIRMIVFEGLRVAVPGVMLGILGALGLTRFLQGLLYGVEPTDTTTFVQIAMLMIAVAAAAAWVPARRAVRGSPIRSILSE